MLFTHFGMSGPLVLSASAHIRDMKNTATASVLTSSLRCRRKSFISASPRTLRFLRTGRLRTAL